MGRYGLGFYYQVVESELGEHTCGIGAEFRSRGEADSPLPAAAGHHFDAGYPPSTGTTATGVKGAV